MATATEAAGPGPGSAPTRPSGAGSASASLVPPNQTVYLSNLPEKVRKDGKWQRDTESRHQRRKERGEKPRLARAAVDAAPALSDAPPGPPPRPCPASTPTPTPTIYPQT